MRRRSAAFLLAGAMMPGVATAQLALPPTLDPSAINEAARREQQRRGEPAAPQGDVVTTAPAPDAALPTGQATVTLRQLVFDDSAYLSRTDLDALARPYVGQTIGIDALRTLIDAVNARYKALGVATARAILPPQRIVDGVVRIHLIEGRVGTVTMTGGSARETAGLSEKLAGTPGTLADPRALEARILRYNRTRDGRVTASLSAGDGEGQTDIAMTLTQPSRLAFDLFADNNGYASTGVLEGGYSVRLYRLFDPADRAVVSFLGSDGVRSLSANYGVAFGDGWRAGLGYSRGLTRVTGGALANADIRGSSDSATADLSLLLVSTTRLGLTLGVSARETDASVDVAGTPVSRGRTTVAGARASIGWTVPGLSVQTTQAVDVARDEERLTGNVRRVTLYHGDADLTGRSRGPIYARVRALWQATSSRDIGGNLQFFASGAGGVRGVAPGILSGDDGVYASSEIGAVVASGAGSVNVSGFVDGARLSQAGTLVSGYSTGVALSLGGPRYALSASLAQPFGRMTAGSRLRGLVSFRLSL